jgi:hypothetical protein
MSSNHPEPPPVSPAVAQAWRDDAERDPDRQRAYLRFLQKRPLRSRGHLLQIVGWLGAGMLLGVGSLYAATALPWRLLLTHSNRLESQHGGGRALPSARSAASSTAVSASGAAPVPLTPEPQAPVTAAFSERVEPAPSSAAHETWQRAARALRERDFDTANDALARLSQQGSQAEREAASLLRAQFLLNEQRTVEARDLLVELTRTSRSAVIRGKADSLLAAIQKSTNAHRSFDIAPGTNQP